MDTGGDDTAGNPAEDAAEAQTKYVVRLMSRVLGSFTGFVVGEGWGSLWRDGEWHPGVRSQLLAYSTAGVVTFAWQVDHGFTAGPTDAIRAALERWAADRGDLEPRQIPGWLSEEEALHLRQGATTVEETLAALRSGWPVGTDSTLAVLRALPVGLLGAVGLRSLREVATATAAVTHTGPTTLAAAGLVAQLYAEALAASTTDDDVGLVQVIDSVITSRPVTDPLRWRLEHLLRQDPRSLREPGQRPAPEDPAEVVLTALAALLAHPGRDVESWLAALRSVVEARDPVAVRCLVGLLHGALYCPGYTPDLEPGVPVDARLWGEMFPVLAMLAEDVVLGLVVEPAGRSADDAEADGWCRRYPA